MELFGSLVHTGTGIWEAFAGFCMDLTDAKLRGHEPSKSFAGDVQPENKHIMSII